MNMSTETSNDSPLHLELVGRVDEARREIEDNVHRDVSRLISLVNVLKEQVGDETKATIVDIRTSKLTEVVMDIVVCAKSNHRKGLMWEELCRRSSELLEHLRTRLQSECKDDDWLYDELRTDIERTVNMPLAQSEDESDGNDDDYSTETSDSSNRRDPPHFPPSKYNPHRDESDYDYTDWLGGGPL